MARPKKYEDKNGKEFYGFESEADLKSYVTQQKSESSFETGTSSGGVEIGAGLQGLFENMAKERKAKYSVVPKDLSGDNAAMIAWVGILDQKNLTDPEKADIDSRWRTDETEINWI